MTNVMSRFNFGQDRPISLILQLCAFLLAALIGAASAITGGIAGIAICAALLGLALLTSPRTTVWVTIVGGLAIGGLVELYIPSLQAIRWAFSLLSVFLAGICSLKLIAQKKLARPPIEFATALALALGLFAAVGALSVLVGNLSPLNVLTGLKNYFQMWGLMIAIAWLGYKPIQATRFILFLGVLALIQMPFVLHQFFVLVPQRSSAIDAAHNVVAVDVVAGTFGGSMGGGGRSADLAVLSVIAVTLFFAQWKANFRKLGSTVSLSALAFSPILLNEAKLALVLLPVGLFVLFRKTIFERPFTWLLGASAVFTVLVAVIIGYSNLPGADSQQSRSVGDYIESSISYNLGKQGYGGAVLNRSTVYPFWANEHIRSQDYLHAFFGHGLGFSNATAILRGDNSAASRYAGYAIGLTGFSTLLWDTGLVGTLLFILILALAYRFAGALHQHWQGTQFEPAIATTQIGIVLLGLSLLHNEYVSFDVGFQTMFSILIGYLFCMRQFPTDDVS